MDEAQKSGGQVEGGEEDVSATYGPLLSRKRGTVRADTLLLGVGFMRLSGAPQLLARFGQRVHVEVCPEEKVDEVRLARARGGRGLAGHVVGHARFARRAERVRVLDVIEDELRVGQGRSSVRAAGQPFRSALWILAGMGSLAPCRPCTYLGEVEAAECARQDLRDCVQKVDASLLRLGTRLGRVVLGKVVQHRPRIGAKGAGVDRRARATATHGEAVLVGRQGDAALDDQPGDRGGTVVRLPWGLDVDLQRVM